MMKMMNIVQQAPKARAYDGTPSEKIELSPCAGVRASEARSLSSTTEYRDALAVARSCRKSDEQQKMRLTCHVCEKWQHFQGVRKVFVATLNGRPRLEKKPTNSNADVMVAAVSGNGWCLCHAHG